MSYEAVSLIATFSTSHDALRAEREVKARGIEAELIPVPREIASDCGFCLLLPAGSERPEGAALEAAMSLDKESIWSVCETAIAGNRKKEKRYERIA